MEELGADHPGRHHVLEWQPCRWLAGVQEERAGSPEGPERVRDLLLGHFNRHADAEQAMRDLQKHIPFCLSVPMVQEQQPEHMPSVPEQFCLCLNFGVFRGTLWLFAG